MCLAIFAGAQIAGANVWETAFVGVKMSAVPYVLPFLVVFAPSLLLTGSPHVIALDTFTTAIGFLLIISGIQGWALYRLSWTGQFLFFMAGACFIWPMLTVKGIGAVLAIVLLAAQLLQRRRESARVASR